MTERASGRGSDLGTGGLEEVRRWVAFGGALAVEPAGEHVVVGLLRCDGGERVGEVRLSAAEAARLGDLDGTGG